MAYFVFFSLEATSHLGLLAALTVLVMGGIAFVLPVQGGIGTFHYAAFIGLSLYSISRDNAFLYGFISHTSQMLLLLIGGAISYIIFLNIFRKNKNAEISQNKE